MKALALRAISAALIAAIATPVPAFASVPAPAPKPEFQDAMKAFGRPESAPAATPAIPVRSAARKSRQIRPAVASHAAAGKRRGKVAAKRDRAPRASKRLAAAEPRPEGIRETRTPSPGPLDLLEFGGFELPAEIVEALPRPIVSGVIAAQARAYLVRTATIGSTMETYGTRIMRARLTAAGIRGKALDHAITQGVKSGEAGKIGAEFSIGMLHDVFAIRLARAVKQGRADGIPGLGVFSAYRDPTLGVGGMRDKASSMHAAAGAADVNGIDSAAKKAKWKQIANANGLYVPYNSWVERNHTQLMPIYTTNQVPALRKIVVAAAKEREPVQNRVALWRASGVPIEAIEPVKVVQIAMHDGRRARPHRLRVTYRHHHQHHRRAARA